MAAKQYPKHGVYFTILQIHSFTYNLFSFTNIIYFYRKMTQ